MKRAHAPTDGLCCPKNRANRCLSILKASCAKLAVPAGTAGPGPGPDSTY